MAVSAIPRLARPRPSDPEPRGPEPRGQSDLEFLLEKILNRSDPKEDPGRIVLPKRLLRIQPPGIPDEPCAFLQTSRYFEGVLFQCFGRTSPSGSLVSLLPFAESIWNWVTDFAVLRSAPQRLAPVRSVAKRSALLRLAPLRLASLRS